VIRLGITLGTKLWYDFTNETNWEAKLSELLRAIGNRGKGHSPQHPLTPTKLESLPHSNPSIKPVKAWNFDDVREWMKTERIEQHFELFQTKELDGRALSELKRLISLNPAFLLKFFSKLGIVEGQMLYLSDAIHRL